MLPLLRSLEVFTQVAMVLIGLVWLAINIKWSRRLAAQGPALLTTMGLFFCLAAIASGLLDLAPNAARDGVPVLLQGLGASLWTLVVGCFGALLVKARVLLFGEPPLAGAEQAAGTTLDDLADQFARLNRSIAGDDDGALATQLRLLRSESKDGMERLNASFELFAEHITETNSKALIRALSLVIRDFNTRLNEQFGDNFKHLNAAVEQLVVWQKQYEQQLNALIVQETATRRSMSEASLRYAELVNKTSVFTTTAGSLQQLIETTRTQTEQMRTSLTSLAELVTTTASGLPQIEGRILEMTRQIQQGVTTNQDLLATSLRTSAESVQANNRELAALLEKAAAGLPQIEARILEMTQQLQQGVTSNQDLLATTLRASAESMQANSRELATLLRTTMESANGELNAHIRQSTADSKKQIDALDKALEEDLTKAIESLGRQLTALSQKFVEDYTPLTQRLRELLQSARV